MKERERKQAETKADSAASFQGEAGPKQNKGSHPAVYALLAATILVLVFNQITLSNIGGAMQQLSFTGAATGGGSASATLPDVIPKGVPAIYGAELGISYDDISASDTQKADATIRKLGSLDVSIKNSDLSSEQLKRYIGVTERISCEYCCGAPSIIFTADTGQYKAGDAACGCAHSYAMRGVAKYLITEHGSEFTDDQILEELGKWKTLFFPEQISQKAGILQQQGVELNYINLASNNYRGIEENAARGSGGGMVGGC